MAGSRKAMWTVFAGTAVALACGGSAREAFAIKQFLEEFKAVYVKAESTDPADKALTAAVEEAKCNVCHIKGKDKKERNAYGEALAERLDKKADAKNVEKIRKALQEVAALPSEAGKADSPTFGAILKQGKVPGGE